MPQKKNPDVLGLIPGKNGRITEAPRRFVYNTQGLLYELPARLQKKTPLPQTIQVADMVASQQALSPPPSFGTKNYAPSHTIAAGNRTADYWSQRLPFRQAHDLVGKILREAEKHGKKLDRIPITSCKRSLLKSP